MGKDNTNIGFMEILWVVFLTSGILKGKSYVIKMKELARRLFLNVEYNIGQARCYNRKELAKRISNAKAAKFGAKAAEYGLKRSFSKRSYLQNFANSAWYFAPFAFNFR